MRLLPMLGLTCCYVAHGGMSCCDDRFGWSFSSSARVLSAVMSQAGLLLLAPGKPVLPH